MLFKKTVFIAAIIGLVFSSHFVQAEKEVQAEGKPLRWQVKRLTLDANEGIDIADINKDGKPDIVAGRNWYAGPHFVPSPLRQIEDWNGYTTSNGEFAYDVNKDGWVDVVAGEFLGTEIKWFENPGKEKLELGQMWTPHVLIDTKLKANEAALMHDFDKDGIPEYVVNSWKDGNPMAIYRFIAAPIEVRKKNKKATAKKHSYRLMKSIVGEKNNGHGMGVGDLNNDGRDDIYFGNGWYEQPKEGAFKKPWAYHADWDDHHSAVPCLIVDLNGDGKNDLIWSKGHDYGLHWWESKGFKKNGSWQWEEHLIDKSFSQAHALHMVDLDGDGQKELIAGKRVRAHNGKDPGGKEKSVMYYFKWNKKSNSFQRYLIDNSGRVGGGLQIRTADLNADGKIDIAVAGKSGTHVLFNKGK